MKNIKSFEQFNVDNDISVNEGQIRKFLTGHDDSDSKDNSKQQILSDIEEKITQMLENGDLNEKSVNVKRESLIKQAEENNWKGKVHFQKSQRTGKIHLVYSKGTSSVQDLARSATNAI